MNTQLSRRHFMERSALTAGLLGAAGLSPNQSHAANQTTSAIAEAHSVSAREFGVKGDGKSDDTQALQMALEAARTRGPICHVPAGHYRLDGALTVPPGVTLCGASGGMPHSEHPIGTVLLAYGGRSRQSRRPAGTPDSGPGG